MTADRSTLVDANVMLRYLLNDVEEQALQAKNVIESGLAYTYPEVLAEVVYVLSRIYSLGRGEICTAIRVLLGQMAVYDRAMLLAALNFYELTSLDFVDCLLVARALTLGEDVATFDKQMRRLLGQVDADEH